MFFQTLALLNRFKSKLSSAITEGPEENEEELEEDDDKGWWESLILFQIHEQMFLFTQFSGRLLSWNQNCDKLKLHKHV